VLLGWSVGMCAAAHNFRVVSNRLFRLVLQRLLAGTASVNELGPITPDAAFPLCIFKAQPQRDYIGIALSKQEPRLRPQ